MSNTATSGDAPPPKLPTFASKGGTSPPEKDQGSDRRESIPFAKSGRSMSTLSASEPEGDSQKGNLISRMLTRARSSTNVLKPPKEKGYHRIIVDGDEGDAEYETCAEMIATCILLRPKYKDVDRGVSELQDLVGAEAQLPLDPTTTELSFKGGIFIFSGQKTFPTEWKKYMNDVKAIFKALENGPALSAARSRLTILEEEFELYTLLNTKLEEDSDPFRKGGGVFSNSVKVDNSCRLHTSMTALQLVEFISKTGMNMPDFEVDQVNGRPMGLMTLMRQKLGVQKPYDITVEGLGLHPPMVKRFRRFDALDSKLNIGGEGSAELLGHFLKHTNPTKGHLYAECVKDLLKKHEVSQNKIVATEYKLPLYGGGMDELQKLADWVRVNKLNHYSRNMWVLQIPRSSSTRDNREIYSAGCTDFGAQLRFIFEPMFKATLDPEAKDHKSVAQLLSRVGAINIYSDESVRRKNFHTDPEDPNKVPWADCPDDYYFFYYIWANLWSLNALRARKGMNTIQFRPTAGETQPHFDQLVSSFLLADSINQGLRLNNSWLLQYLYMFSKVGIVMSPLASNAMNVTYFENPFLTFFRRGLNVTLATEDPLHIHHNEEPLLEEYGTAKRVYRMTATDMSELALNSVLISSFPSEVKGLWLGSEYHMGPEGNKISKSNVSDFRLQFRNECLYHEQTVLNLMLSNKGKDIVVSTVKSRRNNLGEGLKSAVDLFRNRRRINYTDRRVNYPRIDIFGAFEKDQRYESVAQPLRDVLMIRKKYQEGNAIIEQRVLERGQDVTVEDVFKNQTEKGAKFDENYWEFNNFYGVYVLYPKGRIPTWPDHIPTMREFVADVNDVTKVVVGIPDLVGLAHHRLQLLEHKFNLHVALNISRESGKKEEKSWNNRDFFTASKVDGNVQLDAGMNARMMLGFFKSKALNNGHDIVEDTGGKLKTLNELLLEMDIDRDQVEKLTVDELSFILSSNESLRTLFLHTDNYMGGRYFAELTQLSFEKHKKDAYTFTENRLVIRGKDQNEWHELSSWFDRYGMSSKQNRWMINFPRSYRRLKQKNAVESFGEYIENLFEPLWEVSLHPAKYSKFHYFLSHVSGFDTVDDESRVDLPLSDVLPHDWKDQRNPHYLYYLYFFWANINSLNDFRSSRGLNTFTFRPQCGELGGVEHLVGGFLLSQSINHGVQLTRFPVLEYLFYISQIGLTMSPLANTAGSIEYLKNPFPNFFRRGLKVSLATSQPLHFHFTEEPLIEEYAIASKIWKLSYNDLCEIARCSVQISGFKNEFRNSALGKLHWLDSTLGNDVRRSRVSDIRIAYRFEIYHQEVGFLDELLNGDTIPKAMRSLEEEVQMYEEQTGQSFEMPTDDLHSEDEEEEISPEQLQKQIADLEAAIKKSKIMMQSLAGTNQQLHREIQSINASSKIPFRLSANLGEAYNPGANPTSSTTAGDGGSSDKKE